MKWEPDSRTIRDAINQEYDTLQGDPDLAERIIHMHDQSPSRSTASFRRKTAFPVLVAVICILLGATALAVTLAITSTNKYVAPVSSGTWRYTDGALTYQGENDKKPRTIVEDADIRFITTDSATNQVYYVTRKDKAT